MQSRPGDGERRGPAAEDVNKKLLFTSPPAVAVAATARATATVFEKALAPAPAPLVARTERLGSRPAEEIRAAEEMQARPAATVNFEEESSAGSHAVESPVCEKSRNTLHRRRRGAVN